MNQKLKKADAILALGSHDKRVAKRAADLFLDKYAPLLIFSGSHGVRSFEKSEAEIFADIAIGMGVSKDKIIIENKSTNTGENIQFTRKLLDKKNLKIDSFIIVQKPYMERRTYATFAKQWPGKEFVVTSPKIDFIDYADENYPQDYLINIMVGDLQRIIEYPKMGFQIYQDVPNKVLKAFRELIDSGYTERLIDEKSSK